AAGRASEPRRTRAGARPGRDLAQDVHRNLAGTHRRRPRPTSRRPARRGNVGDRRVGRRARRVDRAGARRPGRGACGPAPPRARRRRGGCGMRGRWAQGLEPRYFTWVITGRFAVSERPGGFARNHRKVRRQEELLWLAGHGFTHVLSLLDSPHNLHAYEEVGLAYEHVPLGRHDELPERLRDGYTTLSRWVDEPTGRGPMPAA